MSPDRGNTAIATLAEAPGTPSPAAIASRLVRGSAIYTGANFALKGLGFLLIALYTRYMLPADFGSVALAETIGMVLATVAGLGLSGAASRLYFQYADDPAHLRDYVGSVAWFSAASAAAIAALALLLGPTLVRFVAPRFSLAFYPYIALAIGTAVANQLIELRLTIYRSQGRPRAYTWFTTLAFLLSAIAVIVFVVAFRWGAVGMLVGKLAGALLAVVVAVAVSWDWLRARRNRGYVQETLALGMPLVPHNLIALALVAADRFILNHYRDLSEVGLYSVAYTIGMAMYLITASLLQAWAPLFFDAAEGRKLSPKALGRMSTALVLLLCGLAVAGSLVAQDFVAYFLNARYHSAGRLVPWIIAGYLLHGLFSVFQLSFLQGKRTAVLWMLSAIALAANLAGNFLLVPRWGAAGAAWATVIGYAIEATLAYVWAQKAYRVAFDVPRLGLGMALVAAALAWTEGRWGHSGHPALTIGMVLLAALLLWVISDVKLAELRLLRSGESSPA